MAFIIQFLKFRRGVPEVVHTLRCAAADESAALASAQRLVGTRVWPMRTDALRVMDDGGRTLINWMVPVTAAQPTTPVRRPVGERIVADSRPASPLRVERADRREETTAAPRRRHRFDVGQPVSYAEDGKPEIWKGGYEIVMLCDSSACEPQYAIRSADQSYDRIVREHELCEDLGARVRGQ